MLTTFAADYLRNSFLTKRPSEVYGVVFRFGINKYAALIYLGLVKLGLLETLFISSVPFVFGFILTVILFKPFNSN